jgi:hypothetical protein
VMKTLQRSSFLNLPIACSTCSMDRMLPSRHIYLVTLGFS